MGAEDNDERGAPVGTDLTAGLDVGSEEWLSVNADSTDSGREVI